MDDDKQAALDDIGSSLLPRLLRHVPEQHWLRFSMLILILARYASLHVEVGSGRKRISVCIGCLFSHWSADPGKSSMMHANHYDQIHEFINKRSIYHILF